MTMDVLFHEMCRRQGDAAAALWKRHANLE